MAKPRVGEAPTERAQTPVPGRARRWWVYQRERFPLATHVPLIAAFSFCTLSYSSLARGVVRLPDPRAVFVAFVTALTFFLQLLIADKFKDFYDDALYLPQRTVTTGLF